MESRLVVGVKGGDSDSDTKRLLQRRRTVRPTAQGQAGENGHSPPREVVLSTLRAGHWHPASPTPKYTLGGGEEQHARHNRQRENMAAKHTHCTRMHTLRP